MDSVALIAPDFSIILLGLLLRLKFDYSEDFWKQAERLVFYVLFPPLLFTSISGSSLSLGESAGFLAAGIGAMLIGVCASWCIRYLVKADPVTHASLFQCGFRFNTYIGFALALKLFGDQGFALLALLIAFWVPISNTIAVSALAGAVAKRDAALGEQTNGSKPSLMVVTGKAVAQNPLIIATVLGLCCNLLGITVPATIHHFLKGLGNASLAMGLLCIGAGLRFAALRGSWGLILTGAVQRLMLLPLVSWGVTEVCGLPPAAAGVVILFAALPTAQSCYVMTAAMRGNAPAVAAATSLQTLAAIVTLPIWISLAIL